MNPAPPRLTNQRLRATCVFMVILGGLLVLTASFTAAEDKTAPAPTAASLSSAIDSLIDAKLDASDVRPAPRSDDAEFLRRVYLDLVGTVPTVEEVVAFRKDRSRDKRAKTVEALLASDAYAEYWGTVWFKATIGLSPAARGSRGGGEGARYIRGKPGEIYLAWLQDQIAAERPYNELVHDLVTATGRSDEQGAAGFLARWSENVNNLASATSKVFLGTRIQCAQCHDHIYEETWKQKDFQGMAAFFATTKFDRAPEYREFRRLQRQMQAARQEERDDKPSPGLGRGGDGMDGEMDAPRDGKRPGARPAYPGTQDMSPKEMREAMTKLRGSASTLVVSEQQFGPREAERIQRRLEGRKKGNQQNVEKFRERMVLMTTTPKFWLSAEAADVPGIPRRLLLARWITSNENRQFAKTLVNRYWGHFLGYGFVHPVDDFGSFNTPSHDGVLDLLADDFVANGYDLKRVIRAIVSTEAYQRTSRGVSDDEPDPQLFARAQVRPLSTEQLYHALVRATGIDRRLDRRSRRAAERVQAAVFAAFSFVFDDDEGAESLDFEGSIPQGLFLMNGKLMQEAIRASRGTFLQDVMREGDSHADRVETMYLAALGRDPEAAETNTAVRFLKSERGAPEAYEDLWWALLNSAEFMTNH